MRRFDDLGWYSGGHAIVGDVVGHNAVCADDGSVANRDPRHHADVVAQPNVVADDNRPLAV